MAAVAASIEILQLISKYFRHQEPALDGKMFPNFLKINSLSPLQQVSTSVGEKRQDCPVEIILNCRTVQLIKLINLISKIWKAGFYFCFQIWRKTISYSFQDLRKI